MNIIIVSVSNLSQEAYWQSHLQEQFKDTKTIILCIAEDWPGGAGNGLGTLYAYVKARKKAKELYQIDILQRQKEGASAAIYHTAGQGKRLAPLTLSEHNNKSAVLLPAFRSHDKQQPLTILDTVIKQTELLSTYLKGRLGVFWSDQIFIPGIDFTKVTPKHHVEIVTKPIPFQSQVPNSHEWHKHHLKNYGIVAKNAHGHAMQMDKMEFETFTGLSQKGKIAIDKPISVSLGSFNLSADILEGLLHEFQRELEQKRGKLDTDPHFWMPLTLDQETYRIMQGKNELQGHYVRMQQFRKGWDPATLFGNIDIGQSYWWDYGSFQAYYRNNIKCVEHSDEGKAMRAFFALPEPKSDALCENSILINCRIKSGKIKNSLLVNVTAENVEIDDSLVIESHLANLKCAKSLLYKVEEGSDLILDKETVRADVQNLNHHTFITHMSRDSKLDWEQAILSNPLSYQDAFLKDEG